MIPLRLMHTLGKLPCARRGADPASVNIELDWCLKETIIAIEKKETLGSCCY